MRPPLADSWYSLSYLYFAVVGTLTTMVTGLLVSTITGQPSTSTVDTHTNDPDVRSSIRHAAVRILTLGTL